MTGNPSGITNPISMTTTASTARSVLRAPDRTLSIPFFVRDPTVLGQPLHRPDDALSHLHDGETAPPRHPAQGGSRRPVTT